MAAEGNTLSLPKRDFYGSRLRCLLLTHQPPTVVAERLTELVEPFAVVDAERDLQMPRGFSNPKEAELGKAVGFLSRSQRQIMTEWWLAVSPRATTPTWDIVSTCTVEGRRGLVLIEAKAHVAELNHSGKPVRKTPNSLRNHKQIAAAVAESNRELNAVLPGFSLSIESHYQLCNRFAWSWKIASLGLPVILVYLGFLNAGDMAHRGQETFDSASAWEVVVRDYAGGVVPDDVWGRILDIDGTPVVPIIRAMDMRWLS
jgi:hypothetical protein